MNDIELLKYWRKNYGDGESDLISVMRMIINLDERIADLERGQDELVADTGLHSGDCNCLGCRSDRR